MILPMLKSFTSIFKGLLIFFSYLGLRFPVERHWPQSRLDFGVYFTIQTDYQQGMLFKPAC